MTSIQILQLATAYIKTNDIESLTGTERLQLSMAFNAALQRFYSVAPSKLSETKVSANFAAPRTLTLTLNNGSAEVADETFTVEERGCTLDVDGDRYEIIATDALLSEFRKPSGSYTAIVYHDCQTIDSDIKKIIEPPFYLEEQTPLFEFYSEGKSERYQKDFSIGTPSRYNFEYIGQSQDGSPFAQLRLWPAPTTQVTIQFRADLHPKRFTAKNIVSSELIPLSENHIESILLPMILGEIAKLGMFSNADVAKMAIESSKEAEMRASRLIETHIDSRKNGIGTRRGW